MTDDSNYGEISNQVLLALRASVAGELAKIEAADAGGAWHNTSLVDLAISPATPPAVLLDRLLEDPVTARLLVAWRRSIAELKAAEAAADVAGEDTAWFDVNVTTNDKPAYSGERDRCFRLKVTADSGGR
jgi:hypothetical protein